MNDRDEGLVGTDPNDARSVLRLTAAPSMGSHDPFVISWPIMSGRRYRLSAAANLPPVWVGLFEFSSNASSILVPLPRTNSQQFFRIESLP